jgi:hypothetical protein
MIGPGKSAEGMLLLHFPVAKSVWDSRRTAMLNVDLYHQGQQSLLIEHTSEVVSNASQSPATNGPSATTN